MAAKSTRVETGIYRIHAKGCDGRDGCKCPPKFQAAVYAARDGKLIRETFPTKREAKVWRGETLGAVDRGEVRAVAKRTVREHADELLAGMKDGTLLNRSGQVYKPSTIRSYERMLNGFILPALGRTRLADVDRRTIKALIATWQRDGTAGSTVRNRLDPLRVMIREAIDNGELTIDPTAKLRLPGGTPKAKHTIHASDFRVYLDALPDVDRALWGTTLYAGLRRGELAGLTCDAIDLERGVLYVLRQYDFESHTFVAPKTHASLAPVEIVKPLRVLLAAHLLRTGRSGSDLVFGRTASEPFVPSTIQRRAREAWGWTWKVQDGRGSWAKAREDALEPLVLHGGRHSAASAANAAGLDDNALQEFVRHSDVRTTRNIYVHRHEQDRARDVARLEDFLARSERRSA